MKKNKRLIIILVVGVILISIVSIVLFLTRDKKEEKEIIQKEETEKTEKMYPEYKTKEEVIEYIKTLGDTAKFTKEEKGCWYFESDTNQYEYCKKEGIVRAYIVSKPSDNKEE